MAHLLSAILMITKLNYKKNQQETFWKTSKDILMMWIQWLSSGMAHLLSAILMITKLNYEKDQQETFWKTSKDIRMM